MGKWRHGAGISAPRFNLFSLLTSKLTDLIQTLGSAKEGNLKRCKISPWSWRRISPEVCQQNVTMSFFL